MVMSTVMDHTAAPAPLPRTCESVVRTYSRTFPALFASASGEYLVARDGTRYIDFLAGAGAMNYGHNPPAIKRLLIDYLERDGLTNALDLATTAKVEFLDDFERCVLTPRGLDYRVQCCSPSGTNAVEAALKLARLVTGRTNVISFSGAFHGVSTGALAATASDYYRYGLHQTLPKVTHVPYPRSPLGAFDSLDYLDRMVDDPSSGVEKPAAVILETVQGEGGVYLAPTGFLTGLRAWCDRHDVLMVVDDVQVGCGRTGPFFSFEQAGVQPDLVALAKSISAYGLPMALLLIKPRCDVWRPGQHNGTFRGNQLAFVAAAAAIRQYWSDGTDGAFCREVRRKGALVSDRLRDLVTAEGLDADLRGKGLIWGLDLSRAGVSAARVSRLCFERGLIAETCGRGGEVLKVLPPLTIGEAALATGLDIIGEALRTALDEHGATQHSATGHSATGHSVADTGAPGRASELAARG
jgi:diaminobutyrate-2-oxoglutarate transaminase